MLGFICPRNQGWYTGEIPYAGMEIGEWMPKYWKACDVLLKLQGQSLSDWIAEDEAKIAEAVIHKWMTALQYSVRVKIKSSQQKFQGYPESSMQRESLEQQEQQKQREASQPVINAESLPCPYPYKLVVASEITKSERCPACGFQDILACKRIHDGPVTVEPYQSMLAVLYQPLKFQCETCGLRLDGQEELEASGMETESIQVATAFPIEELGE